MFRQAKPCRSAKPFRKAEFAGGTRRFRKLNMTKTLIFCHWRTAKKCGGVAVLLGTAKKTPLPKAVFKANRQNVRRQRSCSRKEFVNLPVGKFLTKQNSDNERSEAKSKNPINPNEKYKYLDKITKIKF